MLLKVRTKVVLLLFLLCTTLAQASHLSFYTEIYPPLSYYNQHQELTGASVEVVKHIHQSLHQRLPSIHVRPWAHAFKLVKSHNNKVLFTTARTPDREGQFKWVGPLFNTKRHLYATQSSLPQLVRQTPVTSIKISVTRHSAEYSLLKSLGFKRLDLQMYAKGHPKRVSRGRSDAWVANELSFKHRIHHTQLELKDFTNIYPLGNEALYIAFSKNIPQSTIEQWQETLNHIKATGLFDTLTNRHL